MFKKISTELISVRWRVLPGHWEDDDDDDHETLICQFAAENGDHKKQSSKTCLQVS